MAWAAPWICGCGLKVQGGSRCPCAIKRDKERKARFDQQRPSSSARGYNSKWEEARKAFLAKYPKCIRCAKPSTVVDHIVPHKGDKRLFWNRNNWQPLCAPCHNSWKQSEEKRNQYHCDAA